MSRLGTRVRNLWHSGYDVSDMNVRGYPTEFTNIFYDTFDII